MTPLAYSVRSLVPRVARTEAPMCMARSPRHRTWAYEFPILHPAPPCRRRLGAVHHQQPRRLALLTQARQLLPCRLSEKCETPQERFARQPSFPSVRHVSSLSLLRCSLKHEGLLTCRQKMTGAGQC
jgi:hypothetical protein